MSLVQKETTPLTDPYFSTKNLIARLFREWELHKKLLIAVDFDDTVFDYSQSGTNHQMVINLLKECQKLGFYITVFTAADVSRYDFIRNYMKERDIEISGINENAIPLKFGHNGKIYFNILLDDRAGLGQAYTALSTVVELIKLGQEEAPKA